LSAAVLFSFHSISGHQVKQRETKDAFEYPYFCLLSIESFLSLLTIMSFYRSMASPSRYSILPITPGGKKLLPAFYLKI